MIVASVTASWRVDANFKRDVLKRWSTIFVSDPDAEAEPGDSRMEGRLVRIWVSVSGRGS